VPDDSDDPVQEATETGLILARRRESGHRDRKKASKNYSTQRKTTHLHPPDLLVQAVVI
jgi:hypothetical protein